MHWYREWDRWEAQGSLAVTVWYSHCSLSPKTTPPGWMWSCRLALPFGPLHRPRHHPLRAATTDSSQFQSWDGFADVWMDMMIMCVLVYYTAGRRLDLKLSLLFWDFYSNVSVTNDLKMCYTKVITCLLFSLSIVRYCITVLYLYNYWS